MDANYHRLHYNGFLWLWRVKTKLGAMTLVISCVHLIPQYTGIDVPRVHLRVQNEDAITAHIICEYQTKGNRKSIAVAF